MLFYIVRGLGSGHLIPRTDYKAEENKKFGWTNDINNQTFDFSRHTPSQSTRFSLAH